MNRTLDFDTRPCALGHVLVAHTERGVCAILLGDDTVSLVQDLQARFPKAVLSAQPGRRTQWVEAILQLVEQPHRPCTVPLDVQGTPYQQNVWQALQRIPPGHTASYSELALRLGQPRGARAVARACASNPLALAVPCHRVVARDGALSGYRWGLERKRRLLQTEAQAA